MPICRWGGQFAGNVRGLPLILQALVHMLTCFENYLPQPRLEAGTAQTSLCLEEAKAFFELGSELRFVEKETKQRSQWLSILSTLPGSESELKYYLEAKAWYTLLIIQPRGCLDLVVYRLVWISSVKNHHGHPLLWLFFLQSLTAFPGDQLFTPPPSPTRWKQRDEATFCGDIIVLSVPRRSTCLSSLDGLASKRLVYRSDSDRIFGGAVLNHGGC